MNMLNSLIIEGKIEKVEGNGLLPILIVTIATTRHYKEGSETEEEVGHFKIEVFGRLVEQEKQFQIGREIKVVGRLRQNDSKVWVLAEHIEFKPFVKSEETENKEEVKF